ncbi:30S ribosomal protein S2 [Candidatus Gottesmanbacteria bacterium RIFCSPLOWO2_01_FULL_46_21]|uniref:Small ribosomal subunit protein uS2 n=2 Tax=Candidatus Gottesmaniibacteriota TaxID=1752720 RepID=A0A1F6AYK3_9BACT|nr:MAG: 30S ribosomal protein S2 [Candidatus Gottesmanbacteria bacterium RIFCSPLOWO2_01_FULL_46_21]
MQEISLQSLLEAGCHFGHKAERWNPKAASFIYTQKDGIHIIDLAKTKTGLEAALAYMKGIVAAGGEMLFVGTKRQAAGVVKEAVEKVGAPYLTHRWIGGFLTNWDAVHKNIEKINRLTEEQKTGAWKKFPKHERTKLAHYLERIKVFYGGVLDLNKLPDAIFIVDVRKEDSAVREAIRTKITVVGVVDTNSDPTGIDYVIPANDDAVGSVKFLADAAAHAYKEGKDARKKEVAVQAKREEKRVQAEKKVDSAPVEPVVQKFKSSS